VTLPPGFTLRPARDEDAEVVSKLSNDEAEALVGFRPESEDSLLSWWTSPSVDRSNDVAVVEDPEGNVCGYVGVAADPPYTQILVLGVVAFDYHRQGIGSSLVREGEQRARRFLSLASPGARVVLHYATLAEEPGVSRLLERHGYREIRRFLLMRTDFTAELPEPAWPPGIDVRNLAAEQIGELYRAYAEAFDDHWGESTQREDDFRHELLASPRFDPELWFLAWSRGGVAGFVGAHLEAEEDPSRGYIPLLGVRKAHRRRGLGEALLRRAFLELAERGKHGCDLHVDADSLTGATRVYERVGMRPLPRFAHWEKELRRAGR
jgi:mycothiol synthase